MLFKNKEFIYIKIGGSLINDKKTQSKKINKKIIRRIGKVIKKCFDFTRFYLILGHGAGFLGHYYAKKFIVDNKIINKGLSIVSYILDKISNIIVEEFYKVGLNVCKLRSCLILGPNGLKNKEVLDFLINHNIIPLLHGDVLIPSMQIFSTEKIFEVLARYYRPKLIIFLTDVDGIYDKSGKIIENFNESCLSHLKRNNRYDVTGEIGNKVNLALKDKSIKVAIINGNFPNRLKKVLKFKKTVGTFINWM